LWASPVERIANSSEGLTRLLGELAQRVARIAKPDSVGASGVKVMRMSSASRVDHDLAVFLADLVAQLVEIDQFEDVSHR
jgi:hypothetical protein